MLFLVFSIIFTLIFALANVYIYKRLFMKIPFLHTHKKWVFAVVLIIFIMQACFLPFRAEDRFASSLYVALSHSFAFTYFFFFVTLFKDILAFFIRLWAKNAKGVKFDEKRRASIKFLFNLSLIIFGLGLILRGWGNANFIPNVRKIELKIKNLKQNLRIAMISDVHLGKNLHEGFLAKLVDKINALEPDLVVIVGDFIDTKPQDVAPYISKINELKSKFGTFYSLGNHEYYRGLDEILKLLKEKTNLKILINESVDIGVLNIAGLADLAGLRFENLNDEKNGVGLSGLGLNGELNFIPDIEKATANLSEDKPSILLSHQPKSVNLYDVSKFDLVLSGHTHAGQVFPFGILVYLQQGFLHGLYTLSEKTKLYVSSGAGFWGPAIRFLAPSEIALLELQGE
ncbi:metallophosphoesterase [Campylobacter sp. MIT 99-7217]|uniref:metallophosphoesterase n=1 Tax=Campylobacter sp. MIT 99-7217 TaxID=535091 RepID=UPI00115C4469|nr:metallophosphoesterase [Campylobacter sp. MIT 99-7217]TQR34722.1 metallophosphoesterase [Campylobacter sp. MIT 99-7217]